MIEMKRCEMVGCLIGLLITGVVSRVPAVEVEAAERPTSEAKLPAPPSFPRAIRAKVLVVDRAERTIIFDSNGRLQLLKANPATIIFKNKKPITFAELTSGQDVQFVVGASAQGTPELRIVHVETSSQPAQAMGDAGPITIAGTVTAVNVAENIVTIAISGQTYAVQVGPTTQILHEGKAVKLASIVSGQEVQLVLNSGVDGIVELQTIYAGPIPATETNRPPKEVAQVDPSSKTIETNRPLPSATRLLPSPRFQTPPNPANIGGQVVSPN